MHVFIFSRYVWVTEWPTIGKIAAHSAYYMFSKNKYLIVYFFPLRIFRSGIFFLIAPFPDHCLVFNFLCLNRDVLCNQHY